MKQEFFNLHINTNGQKLYEFTNEALNWIKKNNFRDGILNFNIQHTSASLIVQENADPDVQTDYMPAHIKSSLTNNQITLSIKNGKLLLGTWQGLYLFEHRINSQERIIVFHYLGN